MKKLLTLTTVFFLVFNATTAMSWNAVVKQDFHSDLVESDVNYFYHAVDRRPDDNTQLGFNCKVSEEDELTPNLTWIKSDSKFPFTSSKIKAYVFIDSTHVITLNGRNTSSYEGIITPTDRELQALLFSMSRGGGMDVKIITEDQTVEENIQVRLLNFEDDHNVFDCFLGR